jgi:hypothetical protein
MKLFGWGLCLAAILVSLGISAQPAHAMGLMVQPLQYNITLKQGERQKGFVDVTNPSSLVATVVTSVQAFRQIDNKGTLQFFDSTATKEGIIPDLNTFELGPRETVRLYFVVDGTKLPSGDVFAALFVTIQPPSTATVSGTRQTVRVGTILSIVNGTPGSRTADVTDLSVGFFQFNTKITGTYTVKNTADPTKTTGFYPEVMIQMTPLQQRQASTSRLVYAGNTRTNPFELTTSRFGFYRISASYQGSQQSRWVFIVSGIWRWVALGTLAAGAVIGWWVTIRRRLHR